MQSHLGGLIVYNGTIQDYFPDIEGDDKLIYEVIRVIDGCVIFLDDHIIRLKNSCKLSERELLMSYDSIRRNIELLIDNTAIRNGNLKIDFRYSASGDSSMIYFIKTSYPDAEMYKTGVSVNLFEGERINPEAKVYKKQLRSEIDKLIKDDKVYELLLVNNQKLITEGSRSNVFFVIKDRIITAPMETILGGVTRSYVLKIIEENKLNIEYRCLGINELENVDAAFLTGTSPKILPISKIESFSYSVDNSIVKMLRKDYAILEKKFITEQS